MSLIGKIMSGSEPRPRVSLPVYIFLALLMVSCGKQISYGNIPEETVNFTIRPYSIDNDLHGVGSYKYFPYGYMGVFVYHIGFMDEEYMAYEQACPIDWEDGCYVEYDHNDEVLRGKICKSEYSTMNGYCKTYSGFALRKYRVTPVDGQTFQVSN